jgi:hypothetical protein
MQELAGHLPQIGSLVVSPDLLTPVLAKLAGSAVGSGAAGGGTGETGAPGPDGARS